MKKFKNFAITALVAVSVVFLAFSGANIFADEESSAESLVLNPSTSSPSLQECVSSDTDFLDFGELDEGGRSYTKSLILHNSCDRDLAIVAKIQTHDKDDPAMNEAMAADDWLTFVGGQTEYVLPARNDTTVKLRVFLPNNVKGTSYYTAVNFRLKDSTDSNDTKVINIRMDVKSDGFVRSGNLVSNYAHALSFGGAVKAGVKLKNTGTVGYQSKYILKRGPVFGSDGFVTIAEASKEVSAGGEVEFYGGNYTENQYGIYKIQQSVTYVNSDGEMVESVLERTVINLPIVSVFIVGGALLALISLIIVAKIMKHRKKIEKVDEAVESDNKS